MTIASFLRNIAQNDEKSSRQSVNPEEALRTKRLVDMMMPVVGSFIDQDGEYYAAKLKEVLAITITTKGYCQTSQKSQTTAF